VKFDAAKFLGQFFKLSIDHVRLLHVLKIKVKS